MAMIDPNETVLLDTSYAVALAAPTNLHHQRARRPAGELKISQARLLTTRAVLLEIGSYLSRHRYREAAISLLHVLEADPAVEVLPLSEDLYASGLALFESRPDKVWCLIDCVSFVAMSDRGVTKALTADEHFQQCGFRALLREEDA